MWLLQESKITISKDDFLGNKKAGAACKYSVFGISFIGDYIYCSCEMKVVSSLKNLRKRHKDCKVVRRKGKVYIINKKFPRYKARQG